MRRTAAVVVAGLCAAAHADTLTFVLDTEYSGAQQPEGYLSLTFADVGTNHVRLTIQGALGNAGKEKVFGVYFNIDPTLTSASGFDMQLAFNAGASSGSFSPASSTISPNSYVAGGDMWHDARVSFSPGGVSSSIFNGNDAAVFDITSAGGNTSFDVSSFDFVSQPGGANGPLRAAAHIGGVYDPNHSSGPGNDEGSGWVTELPVIPLPHSWMMAGGGLLVLSSIRRRR